jgi:hypothetical protein
VVGSLLLAAHDPDGGLVYVGDAGAGFTDAEGPTDLSSSSVRCSSKRRKSTR